MSARARWRVWHERRRLNAETRIIGELADGRWHYSLDIIRAIRLSAGRFHEAAERLEACGMVRSRWADREPGQRYRRRLYKLTSTDGA